MCGNVFILMKRNAIISLLSLAMAIVSSASLASECACEEDFPYPEELQGLSAAQIRELGVCYAEGKDGKSVNEDAAIALYTIAAEAGDATSARWLGWRYREGRGVCQDREKSNYFFSLAAAAGDKAALQALDDLAPAQVAGKTLYFFCEREQVENPASTRDKNTYHFLTPDKQGAREYKVKWLLANHESGTIAAAEGGSYINTSTLYLKTNKNTATVIYTFEFSGGSHAAVRRYTQTYKLTFTNATGGYATCIVTGAPTTIWASKIIYSGYFTLP